jgi:MoaA/NifB/PqqE/SkfB family radical SAM enzyme
MSSYSSVYHRARADHRLFAVLFELTYRCNLDCFFCYNDTSLQGELLGLTEYQAMLDDLAEMGVVQVTLSGGEPLAHPDFFAIGAHARRRGFVVRIKSNGHALDRRKVRRIMQEVDPFIVEISLHGARPETHDRQTRVPGSFDQLMANVEVMRELGLRIQFNSTLTAWNENEFEDMFALADRLQTRLQFDPQVTQKDDGDRSPLAITATKEAIDRLFRIQRKRNLARRESGRSAATKRRQENIPEVNHCGAGTSSLTIDPYGNVYPCVQWRRAVGSVREVSVPVIWSSSFELARVRQDSRDVKQHLERAGSGIRMVGFCPGIAEQIGGSPWHVYPHARERLALSLKVVEDNG